MKSKFKIGQVVKDKSSGIECTIRSYCSLSSSNCYIVLINSSRLHRFEGELESIGTKNPNSKIIVL